jgi:hypothetical protein
MWVSILKLEGEWADDIEEEIQWKFQGFDTENGV